MRLLTPQVTAVLLFAALSIVISACGGPGERIKEIEAVKATPSPTPGEREVSGVFNITGAGTNGADEYTGSLKVVPKGDNYEFRWSTTKGTRIGTGVQMGNAVAMSFAPTGGGEGCGVVLYKIASDGALDGKMAIWGETTFQTEQKVRKEGTGFVGKYLGNPSHNPDVKVRPAGGPETLTITKDGAGYDFEWNTGGKQRHVGFGIWKGNIAAASFGGRQCSFALYDIQSNGSLEGDWGGQSAVTFGKETAKRQ